MIGLKRGTVKLYDHEKEWELEAQNTIARLKKILGSTARSIQHVGSTAISSIKAKPIIDIAVAVDDFSDVLACEAELKEAGFYYIPKTDLGEQLLFASGNYYEGTGDLQTHFIHVVRWNGVEWTNYMNFRDYLNSHPSDAKEYETLKVALARSAPVDSGRKQYLKGKHDFVERILKTAETERKNRTYFLNPILDGLADPDVLFWKGVYYLYATNTDIKEDDPLGFRVYTSENLVDWQDAGMALRAEDSWGEKQFWAPDIVEKDGKFYLSYSVEEHLCVAVSDSPLGPFVQQVKEPLHREIKEIDSHFFRDADGSWYLYFVRFHEDNEIWGAKMTEDLMGIQEDTLTRLLVPEEAWECQKWPVCEAPYMILHNGKYYLTYSGSHFETDYGSGYAVGDSPLGPFRKYQGNPVLRSGKKIHGVGHHCITRSPDGKELFILYHCHCDEARANPRRLCVDRLRFVPGADGMDVIKVDGPTEEAQEYFW